MHQSELSLDHHVKPRSITIWARLAVSSNAGIYETWVDSAKSLVVEIVLFERAGEIVLDHDIAVSGELVKDLDALWMGERKSKRLFVSIDLAGVS